MRSDIECGCVGRGSVTISLARLEVVRGFVRKVCSVIRALLPRFDNLSRGVRKRFSFSWGPAELDRMVTASRAEMVNTLRQSDLCSEHLASLMDVLRAAHASDSYEPPPYRCKPPPPTALHSAFMGSEEGMGGLEEEDEEEEDEEEEDEAMGPAAALPEVGDEEDGEEDNDALTQGAMAAAMAALRVHEEAAELDVEPDLGARME